MKLLGVDKSKIVCVCICIYKLGLHGKMTNGSDVTQNKKQQKFIWWGKNYSESCSSSPRAIDCLKLAAVILAKRAIVGLLISATFADIS